MPEEVFCVTAHPSSGFALGDGIHDLVDVEMAASEGQGASSAQRLHRQAISISDTTDRILSDHAVLGPFSMLHKPSGMDMVSS
jgi:hypothetical protein